MKKPLAVRMVGAFSLAILLAGCTSIPQREFQAYQRAFDATRVQSEQVLADYAAALQIKTNLEAQVRLKTNSAPAGRSLEERLELANFDATGVGVRDDIEVRLKAWEVIAAYNEALTAVAAGASSGEIEGAVNGFFGALKNFPIAEVADLAAKGVPYVGVVTTMLELLQREIEARRFREAVLKAEEPMTQFVGLLRKDAVLFRSFRAELLNNRFFKQELALLINAERFGAVSSSHGWNPPAEVNALIKKVNASRILTAGIETFPAVTNVTAANPVAPPEQDSQLVELRTLAQAVERDANEARATVLELSAYHELMRRYVVLIGEFERALGALSQAARKNAQRLPSLDQLQQVISSVRLAQQIYRETK